MILKCINLNTWFSATDFTPRMKLIRDYILKYDPHIITFQELLVNSLKFFQKSFPNYFVTNKYLDRKEYEVAIFSKFEPNEIEIFNFPMTQMNRSLHTIRITVDDIPIHIATTHLESMKQERPIRLKQFHTMISRLDEHRNVILMGDMNLDQIGERQIKLPSTWWDVWEKLDYSDQWRYTIDYTTNMYIDNPVQFRPDRVYYKSQNNQVNPISFKLFGRNPSKSVQPSDHHGIFVQFNVEED